jgi:hypothetical protein
MICARGNRSVVACAVLGLMLTGFVGAARADDDRRPRHE